MMEGVIVRGRGGFYTVRDGSGQEYVLRAKKKFRRQGISPLVGDRVCFTPGEGKEEGKEEDGHGKSDVPGDPDGKKVGKDDLPQAIVEALKGMALCTKEAMHYIGNGNGEFMVSHNGVELKVSIPEDAMKEWEDIKNGRAPEKPEEKKDDPQAQA